MKNLGCIAAVLSCALFGAAFAHAAEPARTADIAKRGLKPADFPRWKQLVPNVYAYEDLLSSAGVTFTTNSLIVATTDGLVLVDGQDDPERGKVLVESLKKISPQPLKYVVVASDHVDHVGANGVLKQAYPGAVFISSPASLKTMTDQKRDVLPTETVADKRSLKVGATELQILNIGRGHTGGDLVVYLPESKVLFMSELYLHHVFPAMITAYPSEWVATIKKAQAMDVSWYVAGHGFIDDMATMKADLNESLKATEQVIAEAKRLKAAGQPCESEKNCPAFAQANLGPYAEMTLSASQAPRALARVYMELEGKLPK
ncbi:MAG: MBL fold metallo-hydrolase [Rhodospirillaceae bacterium]|nr:MBL fold metallo-hydrolase [Rhodospirillaceae bacterium]